MNWTHDLLETRIKKLLHDGSLWNWLAYKWPGQDPAIRRNHRRRLCAEFGGGTKKKFSDDQNFSMTFFTPKISDVKF